MSDPAAAAPSSSDAALAEREAHAFLLRTAELLHAYGTPAFRLERVLVKVAASLGVEGTFLSTPTSVLVSLGSGHAKELHLVRGESGEGNLGKLVEFDEILEDVEKGRSRPAEALPRLDAAARAGPRRPALATALAFGVASASAARLFGGAEIEIGLAFAMALGIFALGRGLPRPPDAVGLYEPVAAFAVALAALLASRWAGSFDDRVVTLASLVVLLPGLSLTVGMQELATRHLVSGVARLAGAATTFLMLLFGVALAWRLGAADAQAARTFVSEPLAGWTIWIAAAAAPFAFAVIFEARTRELGVIFATAFSGYAAARAAAGVLGAGLAPFIGALAIGVISNLYARSANRPALVPLIPGVLVLVPGSLGLRSLTSFLEAEPLTGMVGAFHTGLVAISLVGGLLAANVVLPPRRVL